jgi:hypothetical protein
MSKYFGIGLLILTLSCNNKNKPFLEINITSRNKDTFVELKAFYLTNLTDPTKSIRFEDIKCVSPNKFTFTDLQIGTYVGLIKIEKGARYYIDLDTIIITKGQNKISTELNLGTIKL